MKLVKESLNEAKRRNMGLSEKEWIKLKIMLHIQTCIGRELTPEEDFKFRLGLESLAQDILREIK